MLCSSPGGEKYVCKLLVFCRLVSVPEKDDGGRRSQGPSLRLVRRGRQWPIACFNLISSSKGRNAAAGQSFFFGTYGAADEPFCVQASGPIVGEVPPYRLRGRPETALHRLIFRSFITPRQRLLKSRSVLANCRAPTSSTSGS